MIKTQRGYPIGHKGSFGGEQIKVVCAMAAQFENGNSHDTYVFKRANGTFGSADQLSKHDDEKHPNMKHPLPSRRGHAGNWVENSWNTLRAAIVWLLQDRSSPGSIQNVQGNHVVLTPEQRQFGIDYRILSQNDSDTETLPDFLLGQKSVLSSRIRASSSELEEDLTKNELVLEAASRGGKCIIHGGSLAGFSARLTGKIYPLQTQQLHIPSKAALRDVGIPITKCGAYAGCHICNEAMGDKGGLLTVDEIRPLVLQDIAARGITFREPNEVRSEKRLVERVFYVDLKG